MRFIMSMRTFHSQIIPFTPPSFSNQFRYYDSRLSGGDDPRLKLIKPEWITDKKVRSPLI